MWEHPQLRAVGVKVIKWVTTGGPLALLGEAVSDASIVPGCGYPCLDGEAIAPAVDS